MKNLICWGVALTSLIGFLGYRAVADDAPTTKPSLSKMIADFENDGDVKRAKAGDDFLTVAIDASHATNGTHSLKISCPKGHDYCPVDLINEAVKGWDKDKFKNIAIDFTTDQDVSLPVLIEVWDAKSTAFKTRTTIADLGPLTKGKVTIYAPLADFVRNDKSSPIDLTQITKCRIILVTKDMKDDLVTYMDNVRLTNEDGK